MKRKIRSSRGLCLGVTIMLGVVTPTVVTAAATADPPSRRAPEATPARDAGRTSPRLDVLFIGAHPDDEAFQLSTFGQWHENHGIRTGVVTITRGEGGGNAVGPEEGPALGLLREAEERRAVAFAGVRDVYNLDKVDFFYTVSAPLTEDVWDHRSTLQRVVRVVRETRPDVIVTMDPAPSPGNHGNHQYAGRMAFEAYQAAANPRSFPGQIRHEGLRAWAPAKLFYAGAHGDDTATGRACATSFEPELGTQNVYGVWEGRRSSREDTTWAGVELMAAKQYMTQGWGGFDWPVENPADQGCDYYTQIDSRVPFERGDMSDGTADPRTMLQGASLPTPRGFPLGTGLRVRASDFTVVPGASVTVRAVLTAPRDRALRRVRMRPRVPRGWSVSGRTAVPFLAPGASAVRRFVVKVPRRAETNRRALVAVNLRSAAGLTGHGDTEINVVPRVLGEQQLLPQVAEFERWVSATGFRQLTGFVKPVLSIPSGRSRVVRVRLRNHSATTASGVVTPRLPDGFKATPASRRYQGLKPGGTTRVRFVVTNTDASLPTSNEGGVDGDYANAYVTTVAGHRRGVTRSAYELVPSTTVTTATTAPTVDGTVDPGEYPGATLDLSRLWEGEQCESAADCSATGRVVRHGDALYVAVRVRDDVLGSRLPRGDCKRPWRTDAVELGFDPAGTSENTSTTFKGFVLPVTQEGGPCFGRDADNRQGPGDSTAPGMTVASTVGAPYDGYTIETRIPVRMFPSTIDPSHLAMNLLVYDSDTQDKVGQTRIGWSTWQGVQGDPYRWGVARVPGWTPPDVPTRDATIPSRALSSLNSSQTVLQAVRNGVPIGGRRGADPARSAVVTAAATSDGAVTARLKVSGPGVAHVMLTARDGTSVARKVVRYTAAGRPTVRIPVPGNARPVSRVAMAYAPTSGGTTSSAVGVD